MNEEELKKKYGTNNLGNPDIDEDDFMSEEDKIIGEIEMYDKDRNYPIIERIQGIIQKGKLEQKKEELRFLNDFGISSFLKYEEDIKKLNNRIKQLQKEINSQTENEVLIAENSISDKEVAQPYSKSDTTTKGFILSDGQFQKEVDFAKKEIGGMK